jgi:hypothetical protein
MNKNEGKHCPLTNQLCLIDQCVFHNHILDGCEISIMNYNLYQLKKSINELLGKFKVKSSDPAIDPAGPVSPNYPRPV